MEFELPALIDLLDRFIIPLLILFVVIPLLLLARRSLSLAEEEAHGRLLDHQASLLDELIREAISYVEEQDHKLEAGIDVEPLTSEEKLDAAVVYARRRAHHLGLEHLASAQIDFLALRIEAMLNRLRTVSHH